MNNTCPISLVIPTWKRIEKLRSTLYKISVCKPYPDEIIVHVDAGDNETAAWLRSEFPYVKVLQSKQRMGPGGGRNILIKSAKNAIVASFDDDSYPIDIDYFKRLCDIFNSYPDASVIASHIFEKKDTIEKSKKLIGLTAHFGGGGVAYRRDDFLKSDGFLPITIPYGIEEVDLCIKLLNSKKKIYHSPWLRVYHDNSLKHHNNRYVTAASISNLALLVYLRYPLIYWPYGIMQVLKRIVWLIKAKRFRGLLTGVAIMPAHIWRYRSFRKPISHNKLSEFLSLRKQKPNLQPLKVSEISTLNSDLF